MMRVVFVSPAAELGGAERCLLDCVAALRGRDGVEVDAITFADGPLVGKIRQLGATATVVPAPAKLASLGESGSSSESGSAIRGVLSAAPDVARFINRLRQSLVRLKPNVIHTNGMKAHLLAGAIAPTQSKVVIHLHDFVSSRRASRWLLPVLQQIRRRAVFIANSQAVARDFAGVAPAADIRTVYNVVDTDYFCEGDSEPEWLASLAGVDTPTPDATVFGLVATYARWKGHGLFIEAAGLLRKSRPDFPLRFYVIGGPIYDTLGSQVRASELHEQARVAGIEAHFGLVPFQDDIPRVYRSLNVVVHASTQPEPFGRTIVEAMACARPVIVARAGGAAELYDEGVNAFGFEPGNKARLADAMARDLDPHIRARMGQSARQHALCRFGRSRLAHELLEVYGR